jgi:hypothetical protein
MATSLICDCVINGYWPDLRRLQKPVIDRAKTISTGKSLDHKAHISDEKLNVLTFNKSLLLSGEEMAGEKISNPLCSVLCLL